MKGKVKARQPRAGKKRGHYGPPTGEKLTKVLVSIFAGDAEKLRKMPNYNQFVRQAVRAALEAQNA